MNNIEIVKLRDTDKYNERAAKWYHEKWKISEQAYSDSILECQQNTSGIPQWYLALLDDEIIGGLGVIENDFHKRPDLTPNICAVYVEKSYRHKGIAKELLDFVCRDLAAFNYNDVYLLTDHTEFYEKCGFDFYGMVEENEGSLARVYHRALQN